MVLVWMRACIFSYWHWVYRESNGMYMCLMDHLTITTLAYTVWCARHGAQCQCVVLCIVCTSNLYATWLSVLLLSYGCCCYCRCCCLLLLSFGYCCCCSCCCFFFLSFVIWSSFRLSFCSSLCFFSIYSVRVLCMCFILTFVVFFFLLLHSTVAAAVVVVRCVFLFFFYSVALSLCLFAFLWLSPAFVCCILCVV